MKLISEAYREQNTALHASKPSYGTTAISYATLVGRFAHTYGLETVLDYGAGKRLLKAKLGYFGVTPRVTEYDPAVPEIAEVPTEPADLLVCIDVLEHIEPKCLPDVLAHMESLTNKMAFVTVCCREAKKTLADGRNAHLIVKPQSWWLGKILRLWELQYFQSRDCLEDGFEALLRKKA